MNYEKHYTNLIVKHGKRIHPMDNYYERHHIIPKALGGNDHPDNLVYLTARLHLLAHWLLMKMHNCMATRVAYSTMCSRDGIKLTPKMYETARKAVSGENSGVSRVVITPLGRFGSVREAARAHNVNHSVISKKAGSNQMMHQGYYYEDEGDHKKTERSMKGRHRGKRVHTPEGVFESVRAAGAHYKVYHSTISKWCKQDPLNFYLEEDDSCFKPVVTKQRQVYTPDGKFNSVSDAARHHRVHPSVISYRCKNAFEGYYYSE